MEQNAVRGCCQIKAAHGIAFLIRFGIPAADQHYAGSRARVEFHCLGIEVYLVHAFEKLYNVALDAQHDTFGFRVAHTYIVFDNHRLVLYIDKSQENETFVQNAFFAQPVDGRLYDAFAHLFHKYLIGKRNGCYATHTAGVQSLITFSDTFIVFGYRQYLIVLTIAQDKYRALYPAEEFFDNHCCTGIAEHTAEHLLQLFPGFFQSRKNQHAFTGAQAIGFQHVGSGERFEKSKSFFECCSSHAFIAGGRDVMAQHEFLGKFFAAFQLRTFCRRTDDGNVPCSGIFFEEVENALYQRVFGTHYNHVNLMFKGKSLEGGEVRSFDGYIFAHCTCSRIAGSDIQFLYFGALCNFPSQSVFTAT
ncbi:hypothetical protein AA415_01319 [Bacteroides stercoris]|uniref:Uncharacterized protein n=1 Tax=Bacteroides stercoris TaxID=46506 RepID=A0A120A2U1_BACSE|nr:hypothetical protein AA415_01319 [Bacteroides stercoris]